MLTNWLSPSRSALIGVALLFAGFAGYMLIQAVGEEIEPPPYGIVAEGEVSGYFDPDCINRSLSAEFGDVDYQYEVGDEGQHPTYIYYQSADQRGYARLRIKKRGKVTIAQQEFYGYRLPLSQSDFPPALSAMRKAADAIRVSCRLDLSRLQYREVRQHVDALH